MSVSEHEKNYSPSQWSKRYGAEEILPYFFNLAQNVTKKARNTTKCQLDVPYGSTARTKYDIYGTNLPNEAPVFVFIHGGYWQECSKDLAGFPVAVLVSNGIKVITVGYDLCPNVRLGEIVSQIKMAVEQILKYASGCGSRCVWIAGHSAGAHLAGSVLYDKTWIERVAKQGHLRLLKGLILIGGIYNLKPLVSTTYNDALKLTEQEIKEFSYSQIDCADTEHVRNIKVIVTVGECDTPIFVNESREYAQKLITMIDNVEYILHRNNIDHFDIVENLVDPHFSLTKLILQHMSSE